MRNLLARLLTLEPTIPTDDLAAWRRRAEAVRAPGDLPIDHAVLGGLVADRLGFVFAAGYRAALRALVPSLGDDTTLCVTEEGGAHPRALQATLRPIDSAGDSGFRLSGAKTWSTLAASARRLLVAASAGADQSGRNRLRMAVVDVGAPGVSIRPMPPTPFTPEIEHAEVTFTDVAVTEVLPGDGFDHWIKPFRTVEDVHVHAALAGHLVRLARAHAWPRAIVEDALALIAALRALAAGDPGAREVHIALAGALRTAERLVADAAPHLAATDETTRTRWERDRPILGVASRARAERCEAAWRHLHDASAAPAATTSPAPGRVHHSRLCGMVIDCKVDDLDPAAAFWARALGRAVVPPTPESGNYRELLVGETEPFILVQKVDHDSRVHIDIEADDLEAEVRRLEALGARRLSFVKRWWVLEAPTGQRFCVVRPQRGPLIGRANPWRDDDG
jgi:alkylation response protein AidB-like acyl-CoA dehydrogenase